MELLTLTVAYIALSYFGYKVMLLLAKPINPKNISKSDIRLAVVSVLVYGILFLAGTIRVVLAFFGVWPA